MEPLGEEHATGYSDYDHKQVPVFYGWEGPGPLYRREDWPEHGGDPQSGIAPAALQMDRGALDLWYFGRSPAHRPAGSPEGG
jgi:hypothetical protein